MEFEHEESGTFFSMDNEELFFVGALVAGLVFLAKKKSAGVAGLTQRKPDVVEADFEEIQNGD